MTTKVRNRRDRSTMSRIQQGLDEKSGVWNKALELPLVWAAVAVVTCTLLLVPRAGGLLPEWEPGEVAAYDVLMPMDITMSDPEATEAMRVAARESVVPVYDFEPRQQLEVVEQLRELFALCAPPEEGTEDEGAEGPTPPDLVQMSTLLLEEEMSWVVIESKCAPELEAALEDVVVQVYGDWVVDDERALERRAAQGLVIRNLGSGRERAAGPADVAGVVDARVELEGAIRARLLEQDSVHRAWLRPAVRFLANNMAPNLVFSRSETARRTAEAVDAVAPRSQVFRRGQNLVRRGDRVTFAVARTISHINEQRRAVATISNQLGIGLLLVLIVVGWWRLLGRMLETTEGRSRLSMVFLLMTLFVGINRLGLFLGVAVSRNSLGPLMSNLDLYIWGIPFAAGAVVVTMLVGVQPAVLFALCIAVTTSVMLGGDFPILVYALVSGIVGVLACHHFKERSAFGRVGAMVGLGNIVVMLVLTLWKGWPDPTDQVAVNMISAFLGGTLSIGVASLALPVLEGLFGITTDIRLLELSNQNLPLLKRLSLEAPGTYQHSLAVGNLAEAGADAIGANALLLRVCSYYHDVGKLVKPDYFVENQRGTNPHDTLAPSMSALVIQSHVKEGLKMAREAKLPLPIRQAIATHHGTKLIRYFFSRAQEQSDPEMGEIRESDYRYPGPKPDSKEMGVLLLADAIEAAARTVEKPNPSKLQGMISKIFSDALQDGQLDNSDLTFSEMEKVGSAFLWVLTNMYHHRIDYPGFDFNRRKS